MTAEPLHHFPIYENLTEQQKEGIRKFEEEKRIFRENLIKKWENKNEPEIIKQIEVKPKEKAAPWHQCHKCYMRCNCTNIPCSCCDWKAEAMTKPRPSLPEPNKPPIKAKPAPTNKPTYKRGQRKRHKPNQIGMDLS